MGRFNGVIILATSCFLATLQQDLAAAEPALKACGEALNTLNKGNLTELKSFGTPPDDVIKVWPVNGVEDICCDHASFAGSRCSDGAFVTGGQACQGPFVEGWQGCDGQGRRLLGISHQL